MRTAAILLLLAGCQKPGTTTPEPPAAPPQAAQPPGDVWQDAAARVTLASGKREGGEMFVGFRVEATTPDTLVDLDAWDVSAATATDSNGNRLKMLAPPVGLVSGSVRHGRPAAFVLCFEEPSATFTHVDVSFGPATIRVPRKK